MKTSIKPLLNVRKDSVDRRYTLVLQVIHNRQRGVIFTPYKLLPEEFDLKKGLAVAVSRTKVHQGFIREVNEYIDRHTEELRCIITEWKRRRQIFSASDVVQAFRERANNCYVSTFFLSQITEKEQEGKRGTATTYRTTLNAFEKFSSGRRLRFDQVDTGLMMEFEHYLLKIPLQRNTVTFYLRIFRAVYNKAKHKGYVLRRTAPFEGISFRMEETRKLAISAETLRKLIRMDYSHKPGLLVARDLFLFSFYARGMSFVDMAYLQQKDIYGETIHYRRRKTKKLFTVRLIPELQEIIDRYKERCYPWVLPIMMEVLPHGNYRSMHSESSDSEQRQELAGRLHRQYKDAHSGFWRLLQRISRDVGLERCLSFNVARHSWASVAQDKNIPISVISKGLGHTSERTTHIYLAELNPEKVNEANKLIVRL